MRGSISRPPRAPAEILAARRLHVLATGMELGAGARPAPLHASDVTALAAALAATGRLAPDAWAAAVRLSDTYQRSVPMTEPNAPSPDDGFLSFEELRATTPAPSAAPPPLALTLGAPVVGGEDPAAWDAARASRCLRARHAIAADREALVAAFGDEVAALQRRLAELLPPYDRALARHDGYLEAYLRAHPPRGKRRSIDLPGGRVGLRTLPRGLDVLDEAAALAFAKARDLAAAIGTKEYLKTTPLLDYLKRTGEVPAGCADRPARDRFEVKSAHEAAPEELNNDHGGATTAPPAPADEAHLEIDENA